MFRYLLSRSGRWLCLAFLLVCMASTTQLGCDSSPCHRYFQELKRRCQLGSSAEGVKLDQFLNQTFRACQVDICNRTSVNSIDCSDPDTHVPGGYAGRFFSCQ